MQIYFFIILAFTTYCQKKQYVHVDLLVGTQDHDLGYLIILYI